MTAKEMIKNELDEVPELVLEEILDYIQFLKRKKLKVISETALLSEDSLKKDWMKPEEDLAWKHL